MAENPGAVLVTGPMVSGIVYIDGVAYDVTPSHINVQDVETAQKIADKIEADLRASGRLTNLPTTEEQA